MIREKKLKKYFFLNSVFIMLLSTQAFGGDKETLKIERREAVEKQVLIEEDWKELNLQERRIEYAKEYANKSLESLVVVLQEEKKLSQKDAYMLLASSMEHYKGLLSDYKLDTKNMNGRIENSDVEDVKIKKLAERR